jgi:hypothetical protein
MTEEDTAPSSTDTGYFTDEDQLGEYLQDERMGDTTMVSSFEDAQAVISQFAANDAEGAWSSLDRATVAERLTSLLAPAATGDEGSGYRSLQQASLNLCGPAALLVLAMGRDPVAVANYATELFETGTGSVGNFTVTASEELRGVDFAEMSTRGAIASQAEWMMLGAIRNDTEPFWQPDWTGDPDQELAGMSRPEEVADWMRKTGIWSDVVDEGKWASNPGIPNATDIEMTPGKDVAMLIHANLISESTVVDGNATPKQHVFSIDQYFPNHWVLLLSGVVPQVDDNSLAFTIWTWGGRLRLRAPQQVFIDNYFGTVTGTV